MSEFPPDPFLEHDEPEGDRMVRLGLHLGAALIDLRERVTPDGDWQATGLRTAIDALSHEERGAVLLAWALTAEGLPELVDGDE